MLSMNHLMGSQCAHSEWDEAINVAKQEIQDLDRKKTRLLAAIRIFNANKKDGVEWPLKEKFPQ